jgi:hypothetical protein
MTGPAALFDNVAIVWPGAHGAVARGATGRRFIVHQCVEMLTLLELCELVGVADTASVGQILVIQFACRIGNFQDALVGSLLVSSSGITTMTEVAGQTGP